MNSRRPPWLKWFGWRRASRWSVAGLAAVLVPKCIACALGYFALAGAAGVEFCGGAETASTWLWSALAVVGLIVFGTVLHAQRLRLMRRQQEQAGTHC